jgi:undecaprenyl-diphosphatase
VGTILSLLVYFWKDLWKILTAWFASITPILQHKAGTISFDARLGWYILLATLPALLAGFLLKDLIEQLFAIPLLQAAIRLLAAGILLFLAEKLTKKDRELRQITWLDALIIGLFQIISVFPGASRSGTTISAGMFRGIDRGSAARFAFLMAIPVMLSAGVYELFALIQAGGLAGFLPILAVGFVAAAVVGWLSIKWLLNFLSRHSLYLFSIYCSLAGILCLAFTIVK